MDCEAAAAQFCRAAYWALIGKRENPIGLRIGLLAILLDFLAIWKIALKGLSFREVQAKVRSSQIF